MKLSKFKFNLPQELIALHPAKNRDESRLMVVNRKTGEIEHKVFKDLLGYFGEKDVFIFNNTKVFPARLYGNKEKTGARIEVFLLRELNEDLRLWDVLVDPARKIRIGNKLYFGEDDSMVAEVIDNTTSRGRTLRFLYDGNHDEFKKALYALGETPLPKYIDRPVEPDDEDRYQYIFATEEGAVVAPAAGLHFSRSLGNFCLWAKICAKSGRWIFPRCAACWGLSESMFCTTWTASCAATRGRRRCSVRKRDLRRPKFPLRTKILLILPKS